ncbi:MAG: hypothetical protein K2X66_15540 [Cyanobacteria bacterium]|nr:hypothetical protein [Cyanobacteriota bacterium]
MNFGVSSSPQASSQLSLSFKGRMKPHDFQRIQSFLKNSSELKEALNQLQGSDNGQLPNETIGSDMRTSSHTPPILDLGNKLSLSQCFVMKESKIPVWRGIKRWVQLYFFQNKFFHLNQMSNESSALVLLRKYNTKEDADQAVENFGWGAMKLVNNGKKLLLLMVGKRKNITHLTSFFRLSDTETLDITVNEFHKLK